MAIIGFIGTGGMGGAMALNLIKGGHRLIVNDLRREMTRDIEAMGAEFKDSPRAVAEACDLVLSMLPHNETVKEVGLGKNGLREAKKGAKTWIDFSSIDKKTILGVNEELAREGWRILDAAAGGVEEHAAAGTLSLYVSGPHGIFEEYAYIFSILGKKVAHVGELGNAKLIKNAMAMFAAIQHMGIVEIAAWLQKGGVAGDTFYKVLRNSHSHSPEIERICNILRKGKFKPRKSWMPKDVEFGLDIAREMHMPMPFSSLASQMFAIAQANELDGYESTGIAYYVYGLLSGNRLGDL